MLFKNCFGLDNYWFRLQQRFHATMPAWWVLIRTKPVVGCREAVVVEVVGCREAVVVDCEVKFNVYYYKCERFFS